MPQSIWHQVLMLLTILWAAFKLQIEIQHNLNDPNSIAFGINSILAQLFNVNPSWYHNHFACEKRRWTTLQLISLFEQCFLISFSLRMHFSMWILFFLMIYHESWSSSLNTFDSRKWTKLVLLFKQQTNDHVLRLHSI